jgi:hypothetical protein
METSIVHRARWPTITMTTLEFLRYRVACCHVIWCECADNALETEKVGVAGVLFLCDHQYFVPFSFLGLRFYTREMTDWRHSEFGLVMSAKDHAPTREFESQAGVDH